nr:alpha-(1->3)-arabinofuranosyltransferase family protein [Corynebacterium appendicis]
MAEPAPAPALRRFFGGFFSRVSGRTHLVGWVALTLLAFLQAPGRTAADTKFDLTADPGAFLAAATHAYTDRFTLGQIQNQAYGYLFPHGAFFWLTEPLPDWVAQRIWWAIVMGTAFSGTVVLGQRIGLKGASLSVAALLYALSPRVLTTLTAISSEAWPVALVPWTVAPLLAPRLRRGDVAAAVIPVALMGAVNATATMMACLPAFVLLIYRLAWKPLAGWLLGVALVSAWWIGPLLVLGRYSPPFTDFIESSYVTTRWLNLAEVLRGTTSWSPFVDTERTAGHLLVAEPVFVLATLAVAAFGVAGLALRSMPWRGYLAVLLCLGVGLLAAAHGPFGDAWLSLLDGPAAPFRNLHKLDPLVRLPLALGAGYALSRARTPVVVAGVLVTVLATSPAWTLRLAPEGTWTAVSSDWQDAAEFIDANAAGTRTLVVPEAQFARQTWGWTRDEPIQGLTSTRFAARDAVPLVDPEAVRGLDGQVAALDPEALRAIGVGAVAVRDDLASGPEAPSLDDSFGEPERFGDVTVYLLDPQRDMMISSPDLPTVAGGGEVLPLLDRAFGYSPRAIVGSSDADIVTDTPALAKRNYGTLTGPSSSHLHDLSEGGEIRNRVPDYPSNAQRVAVMAEGGSVRASSSASDATSFGGARPAESLTAAVDGLDDTAWHPTPGDRSPWFEISPGDPVREVTVAATDDVEATVSWPGGSREITLEADEPLAVGVGTEDARVAGPIRVALDEPAGISEFDAGVTRTVTVPGTGDTYFFQRLLPADDVIRRAFTTDRPATWELTHAAEIDGEHHDEGPVELPAGEHTIVTDAETVALTRAGHPSAAAWSPFDGTVSPSPSDRLILTTRAFNDGLRGTVSGPDGSTVLEPVRVDSGMQAFRLPAGTQGTFTMSFAGEGFFRASLIFGGALSLLVLGLCVLWSSWTPPAARPGTRHHGSHNQSALAVSAAAAVAAVTAGGLAGAAAYAATFAIRRFTLIPPWALGAGAAGVMGLWLARAPWPAENYAGDSAAVTVAGCVAVSCVAASAWRGPRQARS